ncbi:heterokaryon incompatibility protein-domain-containing protein [Xylaria flabelliformis]|nr:heterokaryon incompatibility protein-domain-containing protein [Xylaria flabelliformis]
MSSPTESYILPQDSLAPSQSDEIAKLRSRLLGWRSDIEDLQRELSDVCHDVAGILQDLCRRDSRFLYLQEAMAEFLDGDLGLRDHLSRRRQPIDSALSLESKDSLTTTDIMLEFLIHSKGNIPDGDWNGQFDFRLAAIEILSSVIYEILDVFDFDITAQEATIPHETSAYLGLLHQLYHRTRDREPKSKKQEIHSFEFSSQFNSEFVYQRELDLATDHIRVIELSPGFEDDDIECSLKVHSIKKDGVPEALSYVWGKEISQEQILVDLQPFSVTKNLLEILRSLRHPETFRSIWIDAICINQGNYKERSHQVRLMRDIYSQAQHTIIYLTEGGINLKLKQGGHLPPLPENFGGTTINQFDLPSILHEFQQYSIDPPWCEKQLALYIMLFRCMKYMLSHSWWERIWTLQEGRLPTSPPVIHYRGHSCTFQTLQSAIDILQDILDWGSEKRHLIPRAVLQNPNRDARSDEVLDMLKFLETQGLVLFRQPLLCRLRKGMKQRDGFATGFLFELLNATDMYRATNPRDKIYALESLLPRCIGKLIRIDYNEDSETLFTYATARCVNTQRTYTIAAKFNLLIESTTRNNKDSTVVDGQVSSTPSWAIDFSYSNSGGHTKDLATDVVTLEWFLIHNALKITDSQGVTLNPMFATPSTLFCYGINIDSIHRTGIIAENESSDLFVAALSLAFEIQNLLQESAGVEASMDMDMKGIYSLMSFFCLRLETDSFPQGQGKQIFEARLKETAGKTYFITENGLIGIATAPVREGDSLCLLDGVPVYFVLRLVPDLEVEGQDSRSEAAQRHQIVARAVIKEIDLPTLIASFPSSRFQIV